MELEQIKSKFASPGNESAVLSCVFKDPTNFYEVEAKLSEADFLTPHNRALWTILRTLVRQGVSHIDTASILNQATALGLEKEIGGYDYVTTLFDKHVDTDNLNFYLERVFDASTKLRILSAVDDVREVTEKNKTLTGETLPAKDVVDYAQSKFLQIALENERGSEAVNLAEGIDELIDEVTAEPANVRGVPTGFPILDEAINGLEPGTLTVLGARPKTGKSTMLMNWAINIAFTEMKPVLYIDTEMSTKEQQFRALSILSGIPERNIKNGTFRDVPGQPEQVDIAVRTLKSGFIYHKYYPDFTAEGVAAMSRKFFHQHGIGCVIFDYIKLPDSDLQLIGNVKEYQALGYLCVALKNLAGQLNIPVVTAAQIGRVGANKGRVTSADFADSDRILRYANTLLGLAHKPKEDMQKLEEEYGREVAWHMGTHRLQILDARAGGSDFVGIDILFRRETLTMSEAPEQLRNYMKSTEEEQDHGF